MKLISAQLEVDRGIVVVDGRYWPAEPGTAMHGRMEDSRPPTPECVEVVHAYDASGRLVSLTGSEYHRAEVALLEQGGGNVR